MTRTTRRRLRRLTRTLLTVFALVGFVAIATPKAQEGPPAANPLIESLSNLDAAKLNQLYEHIGIEPSPEFLDCLCPPNYHYYPSPEGPCRYVGPLGGITITGYLMASMERCAAAFPLADGRTVLDAVAEAAGRPSARTAAQVCRTFVADWSRRREALKQRILNGRDALAALMERKMKADDVYKGKSWLWSLLWATFNAPVPQSDVGFKYDPGPLGANLNQDIGSFRCLNELFSHCEAAIAAGGTSGNAPPDAGSQSAIGQYAQQLAAEFEGRAQRSFDASIDLKDMLAASPGDLRISAEANQEVGYTDMCRAAADDLVRIGSGAPNPYSDEGIDEDTTAAPSFPRG